MSQPPRKTALLVVFLTVFIDLLGFGMVLPLLPVYGKTFALQLGWGESDSRIGLLVGLLMSSFSLMQFVFAPLWGRLSDRIGRRPVLMVGLAGSVLFYALFGVATTMGSLVGLFIARIGAGIAGATISTAQAYIADVTAVHERAKGMALVGAAFGLGFTFGPLFGWLALPGETGVPGPGPGYAAAGLSLAALVLACFRLPESLDPARVPPPRSWFNLSSLRDAMATPSVAALLLTSFITVFAFANFESTIALLMKDESGAFRYSFRDVMLVFSYVGLILTFAQGVLVRRMAGRVSEANMAIAGSIIEIGGFWWMTRTINAGGYQVFAALAVVVIGFALLTPSVNSLISRRSDPSKQGGVLGLLQSANSLARIVGPMVGVPLYHNMAFAERLGTPRQAVPYAFAALLMLVGLILVTIAARGGSDFATSGGPDHGAAT